MDDVDRDLMRLWGLVAELSEQLAANRAIAASLQAQAGHVKGQAVHSGTGYVLRRFNTDLSKEVFESELERMNAALVIENQSLLHENKQLGSLLKEYEQTLETVMAKFRSQAHASQQHELALTRHYEALLLARDSASLTSTENPILLSPPHADSLFRLARLLRQTLRSLGGEDPEDESATASLPPGTRARQAEPSDSSSNPGTHPTEEETNDPEGFAERPPGYREGGYTGSPPPMAEDWALEREIEIERLQQENQELRALLGIAEEMDKREFDPTTGELAGSPFPSPRLKLEGPIRRGILARNRARGGSHLARGAGAGGGLGLGRGSAPTGVPSAGAGQAPPPWSSPETHTNLSKRPSYFTEFPT